MPLQSSQYEEVHLDPHGPGDARPTALQIVKDAGMTGKLTTKNIVITGCSSGLGVETARALLTTGARLFVTARNVDKAKIALADILQDKNARISILEMDQSSLASVSRCASELKKRLKKLDILIANAGVMHTQEGKTVDGFETQFGVNHLSHYLFIRLLLPILLCNSQSEASRIIILSSVAHRFGEPDFDNLNFHKPGTYDKQLAYSSSKTANAWTANELERRYGGEGVHAFSLQPGGIATGLMQHMSAEETESLSKDTYLQSIFKSPEQGAATSVWAAISPVLENQGGLYLENCQIIGKCSPDAHMFGPGYASHTYDDKKSALLWEISEKLTKPFLQ